MSMEQKSDYNGCSRRNSTYQHQSSTREQAIFRDYCKINQKHRNSLDYSQRRSTPPSGIKQNSSVFLDQETKKMVGDRNELQGKMLILQRELYLQRKMNAKFRKIITSKVQKEKELETAYRGIVIELRKEMTTNPNGLSKSNHKIQKEQISKSETTQIELKQSIKQLRQEKDKLYKQIEDLRVIEQNLKNSLKNYQKEEKTLGNAEQLSIMNKFYQNQIERLHQDNYQLRQLIDQKRAQQTQDNFLRNNIGNTVQNHNEQDTNCNKLQIKESSFRMQNQQSEKDRNVQNEKKFDFIEVKQRQQQKMQTNPQEMKKNIEHQVGSKSNIEKNNSQNQVNLFSSFQKQESYQKQTKKVNQIQKEREEKQQSNIQLQNIENKMVQLEMKQPIEANSFETAKQIQRDSFVSINSKKSDSWEKPNISQIIDLKNSKINEEQFKSFQQQPNFQDVSNINLLNTSKKSFIHQFQNQLQDILKQRYILQEQQMHDKKVIEELNAHVNKLQQLQKIAIEQLNDKIKKDRQIFFNFFEPIRIFFSKFALVLNQYGQKYNIKFQAPEITSIATILSAQRPLSQILPKSQLFLTRGDGFLSSFIMNFEKMIQCNRKEIDKRQNNLVLEIFDLKQQLKKSNESSQNLVKRIEQMSQFNKQLQYQISELSSSNFLPSVQDKQRNNFIKSVCKRRATLPLSTLSDKEIQCNIINSQEYYQLKSAIQQFPQLIKTVIQRRLSRQIQLSKLSLTEQLLPQFARMLQRVILSVSQSKSQMFQLQLKDRKKSCSIKEIQIQTRKQSSEEEISADMYYQMEAESKQMESAIKQKSEIIKRLRQKIALQKIDIERYEELSKRAFSKCRPESHVLNIIEITSSKTTPKHTNSEKLMEVNQDEAQFKENSELKQFNNVLQERDEELRELREKIQALQLAAKKTKPENSKNKRVIFLNH